ncbi:MAG TPA: type II toxin-antitoxin system RelE/ParE family toxin [Nitrospirae bacterium]|nr:type II toxin-antitoxin system RelE/ParE family toxin [Nitrospirota bacterium]HDZ01478.1 type II toxin-antitoxin system RelE/ParE family toxin [Nitrospirota bacterium]
MKYIFHPETLIEFSEATIYYSGKNPKPGLAFYTEVENTIHRIIESPELFRIIEEDIRRCLTRRFPYGILYTIEEAYILIVAVMHGSREPSYWKHRVKKDKDKA